MSLEQLDLEEMRLGSLEMYRRLRCMGDTMASAMAAGQYVALSWALGREVVPELQWIGSVALTQTKSFYKEGPKHVGAESA